MTRDEIKYWLHQDRPEILCKLWRRADAIRCACVGEEIHLRGLIEFGNKCARLCLYCGIRAGNTHAKRYRMSHAEILDCAKKAVRYGYGTLVLQSGEDPSMPVAWMSELIRKIKAETGLVVTLSLGERPEHALEAWRQAGADRYLIRFETSNIALYRHIHPATPDMPSHRVEMLHRLRALGYETGSGMLVGVPGQTLDDLVNDIALIQDLDLHMIGVGPYVPHPETPLAAEALADPMMASQRALLAIKVLAIVRILLPWANIPSTTAIATIDPVAGRKSGLERGANVVMPNLTPEPYRSQYEIYPAKAGTAETFEESHERACASIAAMGRQVGQGRGDSPAYCRENDVVTCTEVAL